MPVSIACPICPARFSVEESLLGQSVQCPKCDSAFTAVAQAAILPVRASSDYQDEVRHNYAVVAGVAPSADNHEIDVCRPGASGSWQSVSAGLMWVLSYTVLALGISWSTSLHVLLNDGSGYLYLFGWFANGFFLLLTLIGGCLCSTAPYPIAKKRAYLAVFLFALGFGIAVLALTAR
ncbi:MAG: hypothetical protein EXR98_19105 [Gemmataceae bacterium]|nr:hypothetical protein [Gemmataceae bacterium]